MDENTVKLTADASQYEATMKKAAESATQWGKRVEESAAQMNARVAAAAQAFSQGPVAYKRYLAEVEKASAFARGPAAIESWLKRQSDAEATLAKKAKDGRAAREERIRNAASNVAGQLPGELGMLGGAAAGGPWAVALAGATIVAKDLFNEFLIGQEQIQREFQRTDELSQKWLDNFQAGLDRTREKVALFSESLASAEGRTVLQSAIDDSKKNLQGLESRLQAARKAVEDIPSKWNSPGSMGAYLTGNFEDTFKTPRMKELTEATTAYNAAMKLRIENEAKLAKLNDPANNAAAVKSIKEFTKAREEELAVLTGKLEIDQRDVELKKLMEKYGWTEGSAEVIAARALNQSLRMEEAVQGAAQWGEGFTYEPAAELDTSISAMLAGSQEANNAIIRAANASRNETVKEADDVAKVATNTEKTNALLTQLNEKWDRLEALPVA